ncbi:transposase [bacterium]|nr:transposase [bacterium]
MAAAEMIEAQNTICAPEPRDVLAEICRQRCWVHKTANILDKMPKSVQPHAKAMVHEMYMAPTKRVADRRPPALPSGG